VCAGLALDAVAALEGTLIDLWHLEGDPSHLG
jgi:hypothetical protein